MKLFDALFHTHYTFEGKEEGEKVILLLYRHWLVMTMKAIAYLFVLLIPILVYFLAKSFVLGRDLESVYWFLASVYFLIWWHFFFNVVTMYLLDIWIVTDRRVIDNEQYGFFNRSSAELHLSRVQDVTVRVKGVISTLFEFGDVEIQTAGTERNFVFKQVSNPYKVKDMIMNASHHITNRNL